MPPIPPPTAYNCPNCGALLPIAPDQSLAICLYCGTNVRVSAAADTEGELVQEGQLSQEELNQVRGLISSGRQAEAMARYRQFSGASEAEAGRAIVSLSKQLSIQIFLRQQLSPLGMAMVVFFSLGFLVCIVAGFAGWLPWLVAGLLAVACLIQVFPYLSAMRTELRLLGAKKAVAEILKFAPVGQYRNFRTFRAWVEVRPPGWPPFQAEMDLAVRDVNLATLAEKALIEVLYQEGNPPLVVYNGKPKITPTQPSP